MKASKKSSTSNRAFYLIIGGVAILGIGALAYQSTRPQGAALASPIDSTLPSVKSSGYVIGNPNAPVQVTEFGDFECPACGRFAELTEPDIRKNYVNTGKVQWRFIDFPLSMHRNTWQASRAAACADEQGKFWEFHDALYSTQDQWNGEATGNPDKFMKQLGGKLGLDASKFNSCVDDKKMQAKIQAHYTLAMQRQIIADADVHHRRQADRRGDGVRRVREGPRFRACQGAKDDRSRCGGDTGEGRLDSRLPKKGQ